MSDLNTTQPSIEDLLTKGGLPTAVTHQDYLLSVNINEQKGVLNPLNNVTIHPLFLDQENGTWVLYAKFPPGTKLPMHFHTGTVHFFTTAGKWNYVEYPNDEQTAGSYLYEPGGSIHTFTVPEDATEAAEGFMVVSGSNVNFGEDGNYEDIMEAGSIEQAIHLVCQMTGEPVPRYIKPKRGADFSDVE